MQRLDVSVPNKAAATQLSVITYNVWTGNSNSNYDQLCQYLANSDADIICLQEVTKRFYDKLLVNSPDLMADYDVLDPPAADFWDFMGCDGELILTKKKHQADFSAPKPLHDTSQNRYFSYGTMTVNGVKLGFATAHIESVFYKPEHTALKAAQLEQVSHTLDDLNVDAYIISGDINFTGGDQLPAENKCVEDLSLVDVWKALRGTSDNSSDEKFRNEDATWDGENNSNIPDKNEFQRPDRVYGKFFKSAVQPVAIERVKETWSDHYGLKSTFSVGHISE